MKRLTAFWAPVPAMLLLAICSGGCSSDEMAPQEVVLLWSDEFEDPAGQLPDPAKWIFDIGTVGWPAVETLQLGPGAGQEVEHRGPTGEGLVHGIKEKQVLRAGEDPATRVRMPVDVVLQVRHEVRGAPAMTRVKFKI